MCNFTGHEGFVSMQLTGGNKADAQRDQKHENDLAQLGSDVSTTSTTQSTTKATTTVATTTPATPEPKKSPGTI